MPVWLRFGFLGSILFLTPAPGAAQVGGTGGEPDPLLSGWRWSHFDSESGLPSNDVLDVAESRDGVIWAGTARGVAWFDGYRWRQAQLEGEPATGRTHAIVPAPGGGVFLVSGGRLLRGDTTGLERVPVPSHLERGLLDVAAPDSVSLFVLSLGSADRLFQGEAREVEGQGDPPIGLGSAVGAAWAASRGGVSEWTPRRLEDPPPRKGIRAGDGGMRPERDCHRGLRSYRERNPGPGSGRLSPIP